MQDPFPLLDRHQTPIGTEPIVHDDDDDDDDDVVLLWGILLHNFVAVTFTARGRRSCNNKSRDENLKQKSGMSLA